MAKLSAAQIRSHAANAGFSGKDLDIAVAVALAESGGNPKAHNATPPDDSYGLWQINMLGKLGPDRRRRFGLSSNSQLYDPATNAKAAYGIFKGSGWSAWTTYTRGTYKKHLTSGNGEAAAAIDNGGGSTVGTGETGGLNAIGANLFNAVAGIAGIIFAVTLIGLGIFVLARKPIGKAVKTVVKVAAK